MSNAQRIENLKQIVVKSKVDFLELAKANGINALDYTKEASFAIQALNKNDFLQGIAMSNPDSLKYAVLNVASIGLSLNPVSRLAYLVPRDKQVCLDISYIGLVKLATDCGSVKLVQAQMVFSKDKFKYRGLGREPIHEFDPFKDRGDFVGVYCIAMTHDEKFLVEMMTAQEIDKIKSRSEAAKRNSGPWISDFSEMAKKTVIKRASKLWPKTKLTHVLEQAIDVSNTADPIDLEASSLPTENTQENSEAIEQIKEALKTIERTEEQYIKHLNTALGRKIEKLEDLTQIEISQQLVLLADMIEKKKAKSEKDVEQLKADLAAKLGIKNENTESDKTDKQ